MHTQLKAKIEQAIQNVINKNAEEELWQGFIHEEMAAQMTNAAEQVFDASMAGQKYAAENG